MPQEQRPAVLLDLAIDRLARSTRGRTPTGVGHDDADADTGTVATDDAIGFDPRPLLGALDAAGARAVAIGQVAGIMHGSQELTGDLDLLWSGAAADIPAMVTAFTAAGAELFDENGDPMAIGPEALGAPKVLFRTASASGDCCTPALSWGGLDVSVFVERALRARAADGTGIWYLNRADLIAMREALDRPKDVRRAAELRALRP